MAPVINNSFFFLLRFFGLIHIPSFSENLVFIYFYRLFELSKCAVVDVFFFQWNERLKVKSHIIALSTGPFKLCKCAVVEYFFSMERRTSKKSHIASDFALQATTTKKCCTYAPTWISINNPGASIKHRLLYPEQHSHLVVSSRREKKKKP